MEIVQQNRSSIWKQWELSNELLDWNLLSIVFHLEIDFPALPVPAALIDIGEEDVVYLGLVLLHWYLVLLLILLQEVVGELILIDLQTILLFPFEFFKKSVQGRYV